MFLRRKKKDEKMDIPGGLFANETSLGMPTPARSADQSIGSTAKNHLKLDIRKEVAPQAASDLEKDQYRRMETSTNTRKGAAAVSSALMKSTLETTQDDEAVRSVNSSVNEFIGIEAVDEHAFLNANASANFDEEVSDGVPILIDTTGRLPDRYPATRKSSMTSTISDTSAHAFDDPPHIVRSYDSVPLLEQTKLPRGGISMETQSVGRVQVCHTAAITPAPRWF
jgi:hypothetical protein